MARERSVALCGIRLPFERERFKLLDFHGAARSWRGDLLFQLSRFLVYPYHGPQRDCGRGEFWNDQLRRP